MLTRPDLYYIRKCLKGDKEAFATIVLRYQDKLYSFALRMVKNVEDATELALIAFEKAYFALDRYHHKYAFSTWIYRILINETIDFLKERQKSFSPIEKDMSGDFPTPIQQLTQEEFWEQIEQALQLLSIEQRTTFILATFDNLSTTEIAEILKTPRGTICWRLKQARKNLAKTLGAYCLESE